MDEKLKRSHVTKLGCRKTASKSRKINTIVQPVISGTITPGTSDPLYGSIWSATKSFSQAMTWPQNNRLHVAVQCDQLYKLSVSPFNTQPILYSLQSGYLKISSLELYSFHFTPLKCTYPC